MKHCIRPNNMDVEFSLKILCKLNNAGGTLVTDGDSQCYCHHVRTTERITSNDMEEYYTKPNKLLSGDEMDVMMTSREKTQIPQMMS